MKACPAAIGKEGVQAGRGGERRAVTGVGLKVDHPVGDGGEEHGLREQVGHLHQHLRRRKGHLRVVAGRALPVCIHSSACEPCCDRFFYHLQPQDDIAQPQGPPAATLAADLCTQVQAKTNTEHTFSPCSNMRGPAHSLMQCRRLS